MAEGPIDGGAAAPGSDPPSNIDARLRAGRISIVVALLLVAIGIFRLITDSLHEGWPNYWRSLDGTLWRYLVRAPSDGTLWGDLNARFFKVLSIPTGAGLVFLGYRFGSGTLPQLQLGFRDLMVRSVWIGVFAAGFTVIEIEKAYHVFGMATHLLEGEVSWMNHVTHAVSAALAWWLWGWFSFEPTSRSQIELEVELDALGGTPAEGIDEPES
ncbi:MAG: hypothetical protein K0V04_06165 [Deltaproteobacteria bacterium]|nr:hypothetical protein [Deltaproteobacteria bacterium]